MRLRPVQPSELLLKVKVRVERSARDVSFVDMRQHVQSRCRPEDAFDWAPSYAESLLKKLAPVPRGRIDKLEKIMALCIAARAPVTASPCALLDKAERLLQKFDEDWEAVNAARSKGGKARHRALDPARAFAYRLGCDTRRKSPSLKPRDVVKAIEEEFVEFIHQHDIKMSTDPESLRKTLAKWIDEGAADRE